MKPPSIVGRRRCAALLCALLLAVSASPAPAAESAAAIYARARDTAVRRDFVQAAALYRIAAERGHADAQYALGSLYRLGRGVDMDRDEALRWLRRAAENDQHEAQYALAMMLEGNGVDGDGAQSSRRWLLAAAVGGHALARRKLDAVRAAESESRSTRPSPRAPDDAPAGAVASPTGPHGTPQIVEAAVRGNREAISMLLARGADLEQTDGDGLGALARAALAGHTEVVRQLLGAGARASAATPEGETPLHLAAAAGHTAVVRVLLEHGADPAARQSDGSTPLTRAGCAGHADTVRVLLGAADSRERGGADMALRCAVAGGKADIVWMLLADDESAPERAGFITQLIGIAAENGSTVVARILIERLPDTYVAPSLSPAVAVAARHGHFEVVDALIAAGADVDPATAEGNTPLMLCAAAGQAGSVRRLLRRGAVVDSLNQDGNTALMLAAAAGHREVVALLLDSGADSLRRNRLGLRADALAAQAGHMQTAKLIRERNSLKGWLLEQF
jgi:ankyrin repeat protein